MDGILAYLFIHLFSLAAFVGGWLFARNRRRALCAAGFALSLLIANTVLTWLPVLEATLFPWAAYVYWRVAWIPVAGMLFFGLAVRQLPLVWNRAVVAMIALVLLVWHGSWNQRWMISTPEIGLEQSPDTDGHLRQSTKYTCAPCAAAIALNYLDIVATEREMARLCLTRVDGGTTVFNTFRGLLLRLDDSRWRPRMAYVPVDELLRDGRVAVIDWPELRHAIAIVGQGDSVLVHDPLQPRAIVRDREWLTAIYGKIAIVFEER